MTIKVLFAGMALLTAANIAHAEMATCPAVSSIKATPYTDPDLPPDFNQGFKYEAPGPGGQMWEGQSTATSETYLEPKYNLMLVSAEMIHGKILCSYGGTTQRENAEPVNNVSKPYVQLGLRFNNPKAATGTAWNKTSCGNQGGAVSIDASQCTFEYQP
ncbi:hypothetical protein C8K66_105322 [Pseudomonas sp. GV105]|jgi:hypothetical protein|uniref:hypothetical protein n=1 Tax=Pseudomonas TaxID=286 RepID=UPI000D3AC23C|nr:MULTISPECIES: hypothetical protein [Pseudomonas]NMX48688.1 hypothetical protein [Pseudomonas veronii]PUB34239.1 hypothetical protein C8K66_105322 [Pseudomonas sp. GV105]